MDKKTKAKQALQLVGAAKRRLERACEHIGDEDADVYVEVFDALTRVAAAERRLKEMEKAGE